MKSRRLHLAFALVCVSAIACSNASNASRAPPPAQAGKPSTDVDPATQVAIIDGKPLTYGDIDKEVGSKLRQASSEYLTKVYDLRKGALEEQLSNRLLTEEAKKVGKTLDEWFAKDFVASVPPPGEADVKNFYAEHSSEMQGHSFDDMAPQVTDYMRKDATRKRLTALLDQLKAAHGVKTMLPPPNLPRIEVAATGPAKGADNAKITVVVFSDFQCPYCSRSAATEERVMKEYGGKVRMVFRNFPLSFHPMAEKAAEAGACAADQGKFWEMHDKMFSDQKKLMPDDLKATAHAIAGLDAAKFDSCLDSGSKKGLIEADTKAGSDAGVEGTPAFFVNGQFINGAVPFEDFKSVIDRELTAG